MPCQLPPSLPIFYSNTRNDSNTSQLKKMIGCISPLSSLSPLLSSVTIHRIPHSPLTTFGPAAIHRLVK
ncbi:hypothetical protein HanIR_Chr06g0293181 [Helianthus annuus]|nr:hypothetical protein HanIR_Chr06g0293181 [Helianthus annuus]